MGWQKDAGRLQIENLIEELLTAYRISEAPVPVERIAKARGARIFHQSLEDDVSGFLYRDNDQRVIGGKTHSALTCATTYRAKELTMMSAKRICSPPHGCGDDWNDFWRSS
jgi:hypothetical protein